MQTSFPRQLKFRPSPPTLAAPEVRLLRRLGAIDLVGRVAGLAFAYDYDRFGDLELFDLSEDRIRPFAQLIGIRDGIACA